MGHEAPEVTLVTAALVTLHPRESRKLWDKHSVVVISLKALKETVE